MRQFYWKKTLLILSAGLVFIAIGQQMHKHSPYSFNWNISESLPYTFIIVRKIDQGAALDATFNRGDLIEFAWSEKTPYPVYGKDWIEAKKILAIKKVVGKSGDRIVRTSIRTITVVTPRREQALEVLPHNRFGRILHPLEVQSGGETIPKDYFFVGTDNPRSYDSRYAEIGLIPASRVVGKGVWAW